MISIMFHSIGLENYQWRSKYISEPISLMELKLQQIHKEGYASLFMEEAHKYRGEKHDKLIHLNYDDGYLDNWVYLFPILKKYKLKATIFMTSDFIDPRDIVRAQPSRLNSEIELDENDYAGFLSFKEMRLMEASGLVEIQSHAKSHTWYFKGPKIVDFWKPGSATEVGGPVWMLWNKFPELKPFYLTKAKEVEHKIPYGTPIYEHGKSLETKQFFPNDNSLTARLLNAVSEQVGFFDKPNAIDELYDIVRTHSVDKGLYESQADYIERVKFELLESKQVLESGLGHAINGICWPGGGINEEVVEVAKKIGYKFFTLPSKWKKSPNKYFDFMIPRIGPLARLTIRNKDLGYPTNKDFSYYLKLNNGYLTAKYVFFIRRVLRYLLKR